MSWLASLIAALFKGWLGFRASQAEQIGQQKQEIADDTATIAAAKAANLIDSHVHQLSDAELDRLLATRLRGQIDS